MSIVGENVTVIASGSGLVSGADGKVRVSRRDRRLVRTAVGIIALLMVTDAVLYLGQLI